MAAVELSEAETRVVSALLERAWGRGAHIRGVAPARVRVPEWWQPEA
jgi:hypothetical protein